MRLKAFHLVCFAIAAAAVARPSAQDAPTVVSLDQAIAKGLETSQRLAEMQARQDAAGAAERGSAAARLPVVALQGGYTRTNHVTEFAIAPPGGPRQVVYPDVPDNYRTRLDLQWLIYSGGRFDQLERAARAERDATGADLAAARADLRLEITRAFWTLVTAREAEQVLTRSLDRIAAYVRDLRVRLDQGLIPPNELLSAEAQQSRERVGSIEAANARRIAEADLRRLVGLDGAGPITPAASLDAPAETPVEGESLIAQAIAQRPERRALTDRVEAARARVGAAGAGARPQIGVAAGFDYGRPNQRIFPRVARWEDSWDVSVNASWTLWDGGRVRAERAEADATKRAADARLADFDRQVAFEVRQRALELSSSRAAIAAAEDGVKAAAEARRVLAERFSAGVATNTEVLDAQTAVLQAELDRTRALAGARLAEARLARAVGR
ncbi:MAG TPA: TolC family protein [Vicinamibacterales bacterium]|jgi:outer membrane protein TolC